jgi:hypothetical protein
LGVSLRVGLFAHSPRRFAALTDCGLTASIPYAAGIVKFTNKLMLFFAYYVTPPSRRYI